MIDVKVGKYHKDVTLPKYETLGSAGMDVRCWRDPLLLEKGKEAIAIYPNSTERIGTGLIVEIPEGYEIQIRSRSGLAYKGIVVINSPGTIDSDYRGEIGVMLRNFSDDMFYVNPGDRIAQLVLSPVYQINWTSGKLSVTARGSGALGSTGVK